MDVLFSVKSGTALRIALFSLSNLQLFFSVAVLDFQFKVTKQTIILFYGSVGAVKAGELFSSQIKLKIKQNVSIAEWICNNEQEA